MIEASKHPVGWSNSQEDKATRRKMESAPPRSWKRRIRPLVSWLNAHQPSDATLLLVTALVVGLGAGVAAIIFRWMIDFFRHLAFGGGGRVLGFMGPYYVILVPAAGGLLVGPLVYFFAREAKGHGVPEVMAAVALQGGRIRPVVAGVKALASSLCIGTGGSVGREGPIVQIGSALGSTAGQFFQMSDDRIRMLVACGAAAGIAATFNAPVAGVIFALEVILGEFTAGHFSTVVIASIAASVISRFAFGNVPAFQVPEYSLHSPWELSFYAILGGLAALVATVFVKTLYWAEDVFESWDFREYFKPVAGGLGVGLIGLYFPELFGVGYRGIESALHNEFVWSGCLLLLVFKIAATSLTLGSGGSGGVFAPSLFLGAMLGSSFGDLLGRWFPGTAAPSGAYGLVGMAAVFAAGANAPITAVLILFEMTGDYLIILPLMLATVVATLLARRLEPESIYTIKLVRRGVHLDRGRDVDIMQDVLVSDVMSTDMNPVTVDADMDQLADHFWQYRRHAVPVVDREDNLVGIVSLQDLQQAVSGGQTGLRVGDIATRSTLVVYPDQTVQDALRRMGPRDLSSLPVVDRNRPGKLLGVVRRRDIIRGYNLGMIQRNRARQQIERRLGEELRGVGFLDLELTDRSPAIDRPLAELDLPRGCVVVSIRREGQLLIPRGDTRLRPGDHITTFLEECEKSRVKECLLG